MQHRMVNEVLAEELRHRVHALAVETGFRSRLGKRVHPSASRIDFWIKRCIIEAERPHRILPETERGTHDEVPCLRIGCHRRIEPMDCRAERRSGAGPSAQKDLARSSVSCRSIRSREG